MTCHDDLWQGYKFDGKGSRVSVLWSLWAGAWGEDTALCPCTTYISDLEGARLSPVWSSPA